MNKSYALDIGTGKLTTIRLYGKLGAKFGRVHHMAVSSAAEAVRALGSQLRGFDAFLTQAKDNGYGFAVFYGRRNLTEEELHMPNNEREIRFAPIILGRKNGGWLSIIIGAVLIVAGVLLSPVTGGASMFLVKMGVGLIVGGVMQLLAPTPKGMSAQDRPENRPSYAFNGPINTQAQGSPVQVLYGELIVGSAVLSAGIDAVDQAYVPRGGTRLGDGGGGGGGSSPWHLEWANNEV